MQLLEASPESLHASAIHGALTRFGVRKTGGKPTAADAPDARFYMARCQSLITSLPAFDVDDVGRALRFKTAGYLSHQQRLLQQRTQAPSKSDAEIQVEEEENAKQQMEEKRVRKEKRRLDNAEVKKEERKRKREEQEADAANMEAANTAAAAAAATAASELEQQVRATNKPPAELLNLLAALRRGKRQYEQLFFTPVREQLDDAGYTLYGTHRDIGFLFSRRRIAIVTDTTTLKITSLRFP
jgi:hypothetical protein